MNGRAMRRGGFTLVELLVVIAIIGILVSLLLPAVQAARDAARRAQCRNNMKQVALALLNYNETHGLFPPGSTWKPGSNVDSQNNPGFSENWVILILPHLEQQPLRDAFNLTQYITAAVNREPRGTELAMMKCPSDPFNRTKYAPQPGSQYGSNHGDNWARGNYGVNGGNAFHAASTWCSFHGANGSGCVGSASSQGWRDGKFRGVMGPNATSTMADIRDGTSNTIMVLEMRTGIAPIDNRGVWAMGGASNSIVMAHGYYGDAYGPNCMEPLADDNSTCGDVRALLGDAAVESSGMGCALNWATPNRQGAARSMHRGGIFVAMCDGSVQWISDNIEVAPINNVNYASVWDRLNLPKDGYPIAGGAF